MIWLSRRLFEKRQAIAPRLPCSKITGIRLCIGCTSSFGSVVMIVSDLDPLPIRLAPHVPQGRKGIPLLLDS